MEEKRRLERRERKLLTMTRNNRNRRGRGFKIHGFVWAPGTGN